MSDAQANRARRPIRPGAAQRDHRSPGRTTIVSRHPGAVDWLQRHNVVGDACCRHLDPGTFRAGDTVIGTLPLHLAATLYQNGVEVIGLVIDTPPEWRGRELSADQIEAANGRLHRFEVVDLGPWREGADGPMG